MILLHAYRCVGKVSQDLRQLIVEILLSILDFTHVELANAADGILLMDHSWSFALSFRQNYVDEVLHNKTFNQLRRI